MEDSKEKLTLSEMIDKLKTENKENKKKPLTYEIEYRRLLQWLFEKHLEAENISDIWEGGGHDSGSERAIFEHNYQYKYRQKLSALMKKYGKDTATQEPTS